MLAYFPSLDKLIILSKQAITQGVNTVTEAATGIGKTVCILAGVLDDVLKHGLKLLYVCRTHAQMSWVIEELRAIVSKTQRPNRGILLGDKHVMCIKANVRTIDAETINDTCNAIKKRCPYFRRGQGLSIISTGLSLLDFVNMADE